MRINAHWAKLKETPKYELDTLESICRSVKGNVFVDIGCFIGGFTQVIAKVAKERGGKVYSIDMFDLLKEPGEWWKEHKDFDVCGIFKENMEHIGVMDCIEIIKGCSWEVADRFEDESVDLVYIDADHSYKAVKKDINAWFPKVRAGGVISGHDYNPNQGVERAVDEMFKDIDVYRKEEFTNGIWRFTKSEKK